MFTLITIFFCLTTSATLLTNIWLSKWTDKSRSNNTSSASKSEIHNLAIYSALGVTQGNNKYLDECFLLIFLGFLAFAMHLALKIAAYIAGHKLHWVILIGVLQSPMSFFDTTPVGRIINRFAKDIDSVDTTLPNAFSQSLTTLITVVATLIILIYGSWFALIELIPLIILFAYIQVKLLTLNLSLQHILCLNRKAYLYIIFSTTSSS